jgi:hypothetical protein
VTNALGHFVTLSATKRQYKLLFVPGKLSQVKYLQVTPEPARGALKRLARDKRSSLFSIALVTKKKSLTTTGFVWMHQHLASSIHLERVGFEAMPGTV